MIWLVLGHLMRKVLTAKRQKINLKSVLCFLLLKYFLLAIVVQCFDRSKISTRHKTQINMTFYMYNLSQNYSNRQQVHSLNSQWRPGNGVIINHRWQQLRSKAMKNKPKKIQWLWTWIQLNIIFLQTNILEAT